MKRSKFTAAILIAALGGALVSSCSDSKNPPKAHLSAPPGRFDTVIGVGPEGDADTTKGWIEDPIDLATAPGGGIYVLTKEFGRIYEISPDGTYRQRFTLRTRGDALSMAVERDGSVLVAQWTHNPGAGHNDGSLSIQRVRDERPPAEIARFSTPKNVESVHLVTSPDGDVLLLKDGWFLQRDQSGKFQSIARPKGLDPDANVITAARDNGKLMLMLPLKIVWLQGNSVTKQVLIPEATPADGGAISPDESGSAFITGRGAAIEHVLAGDRRTGSVLLGYGGSPGSCANGEISGATGTGRSQNLGEAAALLVMEKQLYVADPVCHRVLTIGLPAREFAPRG